VNAAGAERGGHKKTVSESETVAGKTQKKATETPTAKSIVAKTLRPARGSLARRLPRFIDIFLG
jgi:hypothetical protein